MAADGTTADALAASDDAARDRLAGVPPRGIGDGPLIAATLETFLAERSWVVSLRHWFGEAGPFGRGDWSRERILAGIERAVAEIDALLSAQVNAIIHAKAFQRLEATWRNARYLVGLAENAESVKIKILHITWTELCRDLERAVEFDQSQTFRKVYEDEFGMPGGEPYGLLIGDYEVRHLKSRSHPTDDIAALTGMSQVATAAFAPFIVGASPVLFGLDEFRDLSLPIDLAAVFRSTDYARWRSFQQAEEARFVGLVLPRVLVRQPYRDDGSRLDGFRFAEDVAAPDGRAMLWGSAAYAFASVVIRAFNASGWFSDLRGARRDQTGGGLVVDLPAPWFETDRPGLVIKPSTDVVIVDRQEKELSDLGFIPLLKAKDTEFSAFYSNPSAQSVGRYETAAATINARISTMLQYILCVSRFAHYVKVLAREKIGTFATPEDCERFLHAWLLRYCNANERATVDTLARYPLREAAVSVRERAGRPGIYHCVVHLRPHSQVDQVVSEFRLVTELNRRAA